MAQVYYIAGNAVSTIGLRKLASDGSVIWSRTYNNANQLACCTDSQGNVIVGGGRASTVTHAKYDKDGNLLWTADHGNTVRALAVGADDSVYVGGTRVSNMGVRKYSPGGALLWSADPGFDIGALAVTSARVLAGEFGDAGYRVNLRQLNGTSVTTKNTNAVDRAAGIYADDTRTCFAIFASLNWASVFAERWSADMGTYQGVMAGNVGFSRAICATADRYIVVGGRVSTLTTRSYTFDGSLINTHDHGTTLNAVATDGTNVLVGGQAASGVTARLLTNTLTEIWSGNQHGSTILAVAAFVEPGPVAFAVPAFGCMNRLGYGGIS